MDFTTTTAAIPCASCNSSNCGCSKSASLLRNILLTIGLLIVVAALVWQGITSAGAPDPEAEGISPNAARLNTGILVFREGLEAILVLSALTASLVRTQQAYWKPVAIGAVLSLAATVATWFIVVGIISNINASMLHIQAATGLLAIVVLLIIMNWFFHKIYWAGWITMHNRRKKELTTSNSLTQSTIYRGLILLGFTSIYREGFEVVLFLQNLRLRAGTPVVMSGLSIGLALTLIVAFLTFVAHRRLPYRKMLVFTGIMLGAVLLVMVGEQALEMQQAGWLPEHRLGFEWPEWLNIWFGVYPTYESLGLQFLSGVLVIGSYFLASRRKKRNPAEEESRCAVDDSSTAEGALCNTLGCDDQCAVQLTVSAKKG